ncbi:MAG: adenylate/guanylate cyclase domain-containing protein [Candidatus Electrothrix sp. AR3]|nr:adenylate/guanylate cyclase domain-containing protein [Candidatus Electrothrix sp. AR3]
MNLISQQFLVAQWRLFRGKYLVRITGTVLTFFLVGLSLWNPSLLHELRFKYSDMLLRHMPAPLGQPSVVIVDIDSESLADIGQWPWPRNRIAALLKTVAAAGPAVIGLDILFSEPDRSSPRRLAEQEFESIPSSVKQYLKKLPDHDLALAKTLHDSPVPIIIGHIFTNSVFSRGKNIPKSSTVALMGENPLPFLFDFNRLDSNLKIFEQAAHGSGFLNIIPSQDSIVRNVPLFINFEEKLYPCLVLAMIQAGEKIDSIVVETKKNGVLAVQLGARRIPTNRRGELIVNFSGPAYTLPYLSATDILSGNFDAAVLKNAYVLLGSSAPGLFDIPAVPTDCVFPGVEFHGHALNTILTNNFIRRPEWLRGAEAIYLCCIGMLLVIFLPRMEAAPSALLACGIVGGTALLSLWNFCYNHLVIDIVYPTITIGLLFMVLIFLNYSIEKRRMRQLRSTFSQYLAPTVVEELLKNQDRLVLDGEERNLTILFSDIRNFTRMAEKMSPDDLCTFLNEYLTPMTGAIMERRGTVDKFIGDAIMAFWNAPLTTPDHVRQACNCALKMLQELKKLNETWQKQGIATTSIGIGIHCGVARVGNMGSRQRFEYTVIGDAVNLASRLEGVNKIYGTEILVSGSVYAVLKKGNFVFRRIDTVRVLGKREPVALYQLLGKRCATKKICWEQPSEMQKALFLYREGNFQTAALLFYDLRSKYPNDPLYAVYEKRCRHMAEKPPVHWDGITDLRVK